MRRRRFGKSKQQGFREAYLDRLLDRFVDFALFFRSLLIRGFGLKVAFFATFSVSITRLMAEKEGLDCRIRIAGRDTRILIIMLGLLFSDFGGILVSLWLIIVLGFLTTIQRVMLALRESGLSFKGPKIYRD